MIRAAAVLALLTLPLLGCGLAPEVDPVVNEMLLHGSYENSPCPPLQFEEGELRFGDQAIPVEYERRKQSNLLVSEFDVRYRERQGKCEFVRVKQGTLFQFVFRNGTAHLEILSEDRKRFKLFERKGVFDGSLTD